MPFVVSNGTVLMRSLIVKNIVGIVAEEMLHLTQAGNVLLAIGGRPTLYDPKWVPDYPMQMPGRVPKLMMYLREATKTNLETFIQVCSSRPTTLHTFV